MNFKFFYVFSALGFCDGSSEISSLLPFFITVKMKSTLPPKSFRLAVNEFTSHLSEKRLLFFKVSPAINMGDFCWNYHLFKKWFQPWRKIMNQYAFQVASHALQIQSTSLRKNWLYFFVKVGAWLFTGFSLFSGFYWLSSRKKATSTLMNFFRLPKWLQVTFVYYGVENEEISFIFH